MKVTFKNNSGFKTIRLVINDAERTVNRDETVWFDVEKDFHLMVYVPNENRVIISWILIILFNYLGEFFGTSGVLNFLTCNAEYDVQIIDENDSVDIVFCQLEAHDTEQCEYESVYLKSDNLMIKKTNYLLNSTGKLIHKSRFYQSIIASWILVLIPAFVCYFAFNDLLGFLVVAVCILIVFTIPAFKRLSNITRFYNAKNADYILKKQEKVYRKNNDAPIVEEPKGLLEKLFNKISNFFFGKKQ